MNIEELKKEYANQDNRATAFPIYIQVQELIFVCDICGTFWGKIRFDVTGNK